MSINSSSRTEYEFPLAVKRASLEQHGHRCAICGGEETPDDHFEYNHILAVWFAKEIGGALSLEVIKSLANCEPVHKSCHRDLHLRESRAYYQELAPIVLQNYLKQIIDHSKDDWRVKLGYAKGRGQYGHD